MAQYTLVNDVGPFERVHITADWVPTKGTTVFVRGRERIVVDVVTAVSIDLSDPDFGTVGSITVLTVNRKESESFDGS
jgi:hypothetical protein